MLGHASPFFMQPRLSQSLGFQMMIALPISQILPLLIEAPAQPSWPIRTRQTVPWSDQGRHSAPRKERIKARCNIALTSPIPFLANNAVFLNSYFAAGLVSLAAAYSHNLLLLRLIEERGLEYTVQYSALLQTSILEQRRKGEWVNLDQFISTLCPIITTKLDLQAALESIQVPGLVKLPRSLKSLRAKAMPSPNNLLQKAKAKAVGLESPRAKAQPLQVHRAFESIRH